MALGASMTCLQLLSAWLLLHGQVVAELHANDVNSVLIHESELDVSENLVTEPSTELPDVSDVLAPLDALCDFVLGAVIHEVVDNHSAEEPVPDFKKEFHVRLGPLKVHGHLDAWGGSAGDFSSLFRVGPVKLSRQSNGDLLLNSAVGLKTLRVRYSRYTARAGPIRVSGSLEAETSPAALRAVLLLQSPCTVRLNELHVAELGPLRVRVTGLGVLRPLRPFLQKWMDERMRNNVQKAVIQHLSNIISQHLSKISC